MYGISFIKIGCLANLSLFSKARNSSQLLSLEFSAAIRFKIHTVNSFIWLTITFIPALTQSSDECIHSHIIPRIPVLYHVIMLLLRRMSEQIEDIRVQTKYFLCISNLNLVKPEVANRK